MKTSAVNQMHSVLNSGAYVYNDANYACQMQKWNEPSFEYAIKSVCCVAQCMCTGQNRYGFIYRLRREREGERETRREVELNGKYKPIYSRRDSGNLFSSESPIRHFNQLSNVSQRTLVVIPLVLIDVLVCSNGTKSFSIDNISSPNEIIGASFI